MSIYSERVDYRKIYEFYHGPIPLDESGRSYEIHHIDGNRDNNDPSNLKALTIQEHYNVHEAQEDWAACKLILARITTPITDISITQSILSTNMMNARVLKGTHPTQNKICCIYCRSVVGQHAFNRKHGEICEKNPKSPFYKMNLIFDKKVWWNNGIIERKGFTCPGETWNRGRTIVWTGNKPPSHAGKLRWHNGDEEKISSTCPGPGWERGGVERKTKMTN